MVMAAAATRALVHAICFVGAVNRFCRRDPDMNKTTPHLLRAPGAEQSRQEIFPDRLFSP